MRTAPAARARGRRRALAALLALCSALAGVAGEPGVAPDPAAPAPLAPTLASDAPRPETLEALAALLHGTMPEGISVASLFATRLDQLPEIEARIVALTGEVRSLAVQLDDARARLDALRKEGLGGAAAVEAATPRAPAETAPEPEAVPDVAPVPREEEDPELATPAAVERAAHEAEQREARVAAERARAAAEADLAQRRGEREAKIAALVAAIGVLEARSAQAEARLTYLNRLAERMRDMPEAARRILPGIAEPRFALRGHAAELDELADALDALASRVDELVLRLRSGTLVGFQSEARDIANGLDSAATVFRNRTSELRDLAGEELRLAETLETDARSLRRDFFVTLLAPDRDDRMDALFMRHLESQRRMQRGAQQSVEGSDLRDLQELAASAAQLAERPERIGTVTDAAGVEESVGELIARVDTSIGGSRSAEESWRLAFENEVVTVLSGQISTSARREAYAFSSTLLRDVRAEATLAWERARTSWTRLLGSAPDLQTMVVSERGFSWLLRIFGLALVLGLWGLARRYTGRLVTESVRVFVRLARGRFGVRIGTVVRWSGLLQSVLPVLLVYPVLRATIALLGGDSLGASLVRAIAMPFFWYALARQALLGATRRITPGRPALIEVPARHLPRLRGTYARLGLFVAAAAALHAMALLAIGEGVIVMLVDAVALTWVGVWAAWEAFEWRPILARSWQAAASSDGAGREARVAAWMERSRWGFLLSGVAVLRLVGTWLVRSLFELSRRSNLAEVLAAHRLRRAAKSEDGSGRDKREIPAEYLREFPLRPILGEEDALLLPRDEVVSDILGQIERWRASRGEGSIALIGEKGAGKTTLAALVARELKEPLVVQHTLRGKPAGDADLFRDLSPVLPVSGAGNFAEWIDGLCAGPERVMLLDEAHNVFLRIVGGYRAYDALVELVNATSKRVFWILVFNSFTWRFLNESRSRQHYFRRLLHVPSWNADDIRELIRRRNHQTGFEVEFDEMLLAGDRGGNGHLELVEGAEGYFRLLRETSGGNPRIATRLWLSSLSVIGEKRLRVSAFREPSSAALEGLSDDLLFALAAISQHENLSTLELQRVLNVSEGLARFAVQFLGEAGLVVEKDGSSDRVTLAADYYRQVLRALRKKHLLFE